MPPKNNQEEPQMMPGMPELIEFINALATATPGTRPQMNAEQIEKIKKSPLRPVLQALQPIYRKIVDAPSEPEKHSPAETREPKNLNNELGPADVMNQEEPQMMPGMPELIEVINALATAAPGTRPQMNAEQIEKIKKSPLRPVLQALQPIYRKIVEAPREPEKHSPVETRERNNLNNEPGPANVRNQEEPQMMPGMPELIEFINALAIAAPGTRPQMNAEQIEKIKKSPLRPVLQALQPIYRKIVEAPSEPEQHSPREQKNLNTEPGPANISISATVSASEKCDMPPVPSGEPSPNAERIVKASISPRLQRGLTMPPKGNYKTSWWASRQTLETVPGLNELVDLLNLMSTAPPGARPQLNPELIEGIKGSSLQPVLKPLQGIYKKLVAAAEVEQVGPATPKAEPQPLQPPTPPLTQSVATPAPAPVKSAPKKRHYTPVPMDAAELKDIEAGMKSLSSKLDPALHELSQGLKKLQVGLLENAKADKTRLEAKVDELEKEVDELEKEVKELQQVIDATRTELLPVEVASKIALQGTFSEDADKASTRAGAANDNVLQIAKRVRTNTLGLIAKCQALFTFITRDPITVSTVPDLGTEGEWGRCADHLRASNRRLRSAVEEKEESTQKLQFVGFVVDQIRMGRYTEREWKSDINGKSFFTLIEKSPDGFAGIQLLAQDISRLTAAAMTAPLAPVAPIAPVYGIPPGYGTPPATFAADDIASQTFTTPMANAAWADAGVSTAKPTTGGTRPRGRGNASTNQSSAATASLASLLSS